MKSCKPWDYTVERLGGKEMTRAEVLNELEVNLNTLTGRGQLSTGSTAHGTFRNSTGRPVFAC